MRSTISSTWVSAALIASAIVFSFNIVRAETPRDTILSLAKRDHTLAIVDPATFKVVARVSVGDDPHEVIASPDGRFAYVSNLGHRAGSHARVGGDTLQIVGRLEPLTPMPIT